MKEINTDFQGWPVHAMTLREILDELDITYISDDGIEYIRSDRKDILDSYPVILEDDGMGYGIKPKYISTVNNEVYQDKDLKENVFNIFVEVKSKR
jgi:hypothetical protein